MRVARQAPSAATGRLGFELKAKGHHKGEDTLEKRLTVFQQAAVGGSVAKIDSDGVVFSRQFGLYAHGSPLCHQVSSADGT